MRRISLILAFALTLVVGLGCRHVAGKCDCNGHPDDAASYAPGNPYPVVTPAAPGK